jgi:hypothetical protein
VTDEEDEVGVAKSISAILRSCNFIGACLLKKKSPNTNNIKIAFIVTCYNNFIFTIEEIILK